MPLSLYLDDCADDDILAALLRRAGYAVHTPRSAGTSGVRDEAHLDYAAREGYALLTKDPDDFLELHLHWRAIHRPHSGILLAYEEQDVKKNMNRAQLVLAIEHLVASGVPFANEIYTLNHWR
jgi:predicted nuclease of predicted toxin-antitoxin system